MAERKFIIENFFSSGRAYNGPVVTCRKCGTRDYYTVTGGKSSAQKFFQNRGWQLGRGPQMDTCPACQKPDRTQKEKAIVMEPKKEAEAPRIATREDRRRITEKITEHYLESGYQSPWTDKLIAEALKCPVAWVIEVREFAFGPEGTNEELDKFCKSVEALQAMTPDVTDLKRQVDALHTMMTEVVAMKNKIERDLVGTRR